MKKLLIIFALLAISLISCDKENDMKQKLAIENGWILQSASAYPAYVLDDGTRINDLMNGLIKECEKDDIIVFNTNGKEFKNCGDSLCDGETANDMELGRWEYDVNGDLLLMRLPFHNNYKTTANVIKLTDDRLEINVIVSNHNSQTTSQSYWTIVFIPA